MTPRREAGFVAAEMAVGLGLLMLVGIVALGLPTWVQRQSIARTMAQETARAFVVSDGSDAARARSAGLAHTIARNHGFETDDVVDVRITGTVGWGNDVTAHVILRIPALPVGGGHGDVQWHVTHTERVDPFRSL